MTPVPDPGAAITQILTEAYRSIDRSSESAASESSIADVIRIIRIYAEGMNVRSIEVVSNDECGLVLTEETATIEGASRTWRGIHRWCFLSGRCTKFEVYGQTLVVMPPIAAPTDGNN
jgi:hypothetical protein